MLSNWAGKSPEKGRFRPILVNGGEKTQLREQLTLHPQSLKGRTAAYLELSVRRLDIRGSSQNELSPYSATLREKEERG